MPKSKKKKVAGTSKQVIEEKKPGVHVAKPVKKLDPFRYSLIVTGVFIVIATFGLIYHEMWRDEYQAWLVARDAHSISQLFQNMRYEGNPALWHIFLYLITSFTNNPAYMQVFHLLIAAGFIYVFNRYAPISTPLKILFTFSYFPLYEYAVISRSYGLGLLLIFIVCILFKNRKSYYLWLGLVLGLLSNVTVYSFILASGIAGILLLDYAFNQKKDKKTIVQLVGGLSIFLILTILSLYQIWPDKNNSFPIIYAKEAFEAPRWGFVSSKFFSTYLYIPDVSEINFWNTNTYLNDYVTIQPTYWKWLNDNPSYLWGWVYLPIILFIISILVFLRKPLVLLLYTGTTLALMSLFYYTLLVYSRYCGHLVILLIVCYWLSEYFPDKKYDNTMLQKLSVFGKKISKPFLAILLLFQVIGAVFAYTMDYKYQFSAGKETADYIRKNKLDSLTIVAVPDFTMSSLAAHLNTKIYYPEMSSYGSFTIWNKDRIDTISFGQMIQSIESIIDKGKSELLFVRSEQARISPDGINYFPLERGMIRKDIKLDLLEKFEEPVVKDEKFYIYLVEKTDSSKIDLAKYPKLYQ